MRSILQKKGLRFIFAANVISMIGSGMNSAAVAWYILQATHSEIALGTFAVVQTLPAILLLPFTGVIIDREDRRRLVMALDVTRAVVIAVVAVLAFEGKAKVWELYAMNMLVAAEFHNDIVAAEGAVQKFFRELRDGIHFLRRHREIVLLGISWALFLSAMMTGVVVTPPLSDNVYHKGAVGYGWLNGGWGVGAFLSAFYAPMFIKKFGARRSIAISLGILAVLMTSAPVMPVLALAVLVYALR